MSRHQAAAGIGLAVAGLVALALWVGGGERAGTPARDEAGVPAVTAQVRDLSPQAPPGPEEATALLRMPVPARDVTQRVELPFDERFLGRHWSEVPHELIAAHEAASAHGVQRFFVALVQPGLPDAQVERLLREVRGHHGDAEQLRVRVFDSPDAAKTPTYVDGGVSRDIHLLGDLIREPGYERMVVRGSEVPL